jgi:hypothetical protein
MKIKIKTVCLAIATLAAPAGDHAAHAAVSAGAGPSGSLGRLDLGGNSPRWGGEVASIVATILSMRPNAETRHRSNRRLAPIGV